MLLLLFKLGVFLGNSFILSILFYTGFSTGAGSTMVLALAPPLAIFSLTPLTTSAKSWSLNYFTSCSNSSPLLSEINPIIILSLVHIYYRLVFLVCSSRFRSYCTKVILAYDTNCLTDSSNYILLRLCRVISFSLIMFYNKVTRFIWWCDEMMIIFLLVFLLGIFDGWLRGKYNY